MKIASAVFPSQTKNPFGSENLMNISQHNKVWQDLKYNPDLDFRLYPMQRLSFHAVLYSEKKKKLEVIESNAYQTHAHEQKHAIDKEREAHFNLNFKEKFNFTKKTKHFTQKIPNISRHVKNFLRRSYHQHVVCFMK